jgi:phospholipid-binding lipoprotein MlaA
VTSASKEKRPLRLAVTAAALALVGLAPSGCATAPTDPTERAAFEATNDPWEPVNREIFAFNQVADKYVIRPVAIGYRDVVPEFARNRIRDFLDNLNEPVIFMNNMLQGEGGRAAKTVSRFVINSTVGVGGFYDVLGANGVPQESGDFGQTLYRWGVPPGPYLVLPILGPSDPRDAIGKYGVDGLADPFNRLVDGTIYNEPTLVYVREGVWGIDLRSRNIETLDQLERDSLDFYAKMRSVWRQYRDAELRHGAPAELDYSLYGPEPGGPTPSK